MNWLPFLCCCLVVERLLILVALDGRLCAEGAQFVFHPKNAKDLFTLWSFASQTSGRKRAFRFHLAREALCVLAPPYSSPDVRDRMGTNHLKYEMRRKEDTELSRITSLTDK